jgi:hypothetical protein
VVEAEAGRPPSRHQRSAEAPVPLAQPAPNGIDLFLVCPACVAAVMIAATLPAPASSIALGLQRR